jgi:hypothetical protein
LTKGTQAPDRKVEMSIQRLVKSICTEYYKLLADLVFRGCIWPDMVYENGAPRIPTEPAGHL